ncbi:lysine-N-methylase [Clostridium botulinum]|uniref:flagellin lysine-N-methylase n=1 Tax=Clostridium botulinum TaxID=1491 RepID=UPI000174E52D|nr:flagellin lysine-N-methylase [Clostridium botulinum]ACD54047.1 FliB family protein [Clostridium botulinum E3 str. Alaska E43]AJF29739.1 lysine-N-methylase [Clostridium botulinum]AJF32800.1 lysine-N-methylase [Clostridium botulinum]MBY6789089.1 flagellin lysine-N-methylase [Clostridium botulinum]MBY6816843.1 flagellin lysine-N-methylase [Clostridium botulinum]
MKLNTFIPKYMEDFNCIGSKCTDTCCAGWDINIDEDTYNKYLSSEGTLKELVQGKFSLNNSNHDIFNHGFMILKDESRCPFLNLNMLCDIHGNIGEENLCITCKIYPRIFNIVDGTYEKSGLPSCEEICVKAFLNKDKMEFVELEEDIDEESIEIRRIIDSESFDGTESLIQYFWDIRVISINIMQLRNFSINERLNVLTMFYKELNRLNKVNDYDALEEILENFNYESINYECLIELEFQEDDKFFIMLLDDKLIDNVKSVGLKECINEYKNGILKVGNVSKYLKENINSFNYIKEYDYIFENYIVNQIFKDLIPFNKGENILKSINILKNNYKIIKAYIIGIALNSDSKISEKDIIRVIQALSKDIEHNKVFKELLEG